MTADPASETLQRLIGALQRQLPSPDRRARRAIRKQIREYVWALEQLEAGEDGWTGIRNRVALASVLMWFAAIYRGFFSPPHTYGLGFRIVLMLLFTGGLAVVGYLLGEHAAEGMRKRYYELLKDAPRHLAALTAVPGLTPRAEEAGAGAGEGEGVR